MSDSLEGTCNCTAIKVGVNKDAMVHVCHCTACRKYTGATAWAVLEVPNEQFRLISGQDKLKSFVGHGDAGFKVTRYWCDGCGSPIYLIVDGMPITFTASGLFPPGTIPKPFVHFYTKNLESWERTIEGADVKLEMEGME